MNVSYWDGGYVLLDVTDPTPGNVTLIAESDFEELDPERLARGQRDLAGGQRAPVRALARQPVPGRG